MGVTEQQRHQVFAWFEEQMAEERAATTMELMPPVGASELATKLDLHALEQRTDGTGGRLAAGCEAHEARLRCRPCRTR